LSRRVLLRRIRRGLAPALLLLALAPAAAAAADGGRRYAQSQITVGEWQAFFDEVRATPGARDISSPQVPSVTVIEVPGERTLYFFTAPGGAAHPGVVVERVLSKGGATYLQRDGYFAGSEEAFRAWFDAFAQRSRAIRNALQAEP
jgi:hypothetical protein